MRRAGKEVEVETTHHHPCGLELVDLSEGRGSAHDVRRLAQHLRHLLGGHGAEEHVGDNGVGAAVVLD